MKNVIEFLEQVRVNNNREWFEANRAWYREAQGEFNAVVEQLIEGIAGFDPSVRGLTLRDCTYRFHRDTRFSHNKDPYKIHMGAYICPGGKKSGYAGYYFHVEPECEEGMIGGNVLTSGIYLPEPAALKSIRYDIVEHGPAFEAAIAKAKGFSLDEHSKLKRVPQGFPAGTPWDEYLKLKDIYLAKPVDNEYLLRPGLAKRAVEDFALTYDLTAMLNRAIKYAFEENTDD